jgi:hypothetical protein
MECREMMGGEVSFQKNDPRKKKKMKGTLFVKPTTPECVSDFPRQIVELRSKNKIKRCRLEILSGLSCAGNEPERGFEDRHWFA